MRRVCPIDVSKIIESLPLLNWKPAGDPGTFAMIEHWSQELPTEPVFDVVLAQYPGRRRGMTCFSKLVSGQFIEPHSDHHDSECTARIHVPIVTNPGCVFIEDKYVFHMAVGWVWEIDPTLPHSTANGGDSDRIHLFFNAVT